MGIDRNYFPDLLSPDVCAWLGSTESQGEFIQNRVEVENEWSSAGFNEYGERHLLDITPFDRVSFFERVFKVTSAAGRLIDHTKIHDLVFHACDLTISAILFLKPGLSSDVINSAQDAFKNTDLEDVNAVEADFIRSGINIDDYQVSFFHKLVRREPRRIDTTNSDAFLSQLSNQVNEEGKPIYVIEEAGPWKHVCKVPDLEQDEDNVIVGDTNNPRRSIDDHLRDNRPVGCDKFGFVEERIGTAFEFVEFKTVDEMVEYRIGRCRIGRTRMPVLYSRTNRQVAYAYVVTEINVIDLFEKAIRKCIKRSADETAILVLITGFGALPAAVKVFVARLLICLEAELSDNLHCLAPDLKLITKRSDWRRGL